MRVLNECCNLDDVDAKIAIEPMPAEPIPEEDPLLWSLTNTIFQLLFISMPDTIALMQVDILLDDVAPNKRERALSSINWYSIAEHMDKKCPHLDEITLRLVIDSDLKEYLLWTDPFRDIVMQHFRRFTVAPRE